ncbi:hypothetical protein V2A60_005691 [Cordyceps javanica]
MKHSTILTLFLNGLQVLAVAAAGDNTVDSPPVRGRRAGYPGWQDWTSVSPGDFKFNPGAFVSTLEDSTSTLFAVRSDGVVCTTSSDYNTSVYVPWTPTATNYRMDVRSRIAATFNINEWRLELYATAADGFVWTTYRSQDGRWHAWDPVSTSTRMGPAAPITVTWNGNRTTVELMAASQNGTMVTARRTNAGSWTDWQPIRPDTAVPPAAALTVVGDNADDPNRRIYVVDGHGVARCCPWSSPLKSWQFCYQVHPRVMRPGALISARDNWISPLLVTTSSDGFIWTSDRFQHDDWTAVAGSSAIQPGADAALYVAGDNQFLFGTDRTGLIRFTGRTRDSAGSDWVVWSNVNPLSVIPPGAAVNAVRNPNTGRMTALVIGADGNVWSNWWQ